MEDQHKIALLIDAENVSQKYIKLIMDEVSEYGVVTYKRVYGDFTVPSALSWKDNLRDYAMTPVFQINYTKGKNASDSVMVIDAMDILYSGKVSGFCLVTSDSDFTKLAIRLKEAGMLVIGMGEKKTPASLVSACETFKFLDLLYHENKEPEPVIPEAEPEIVPEIVPETVPAAEPESNVPDKRVIQDEITAIINSRSDEAGWINLAPLGNLLSKRIPGFDPRNYGFKKLREFIESCGCYEIREIENPKDNFLKIVYVKNK